MTQVDHEHVTYWWKRAKRAEQTLRSVRRKLDELTEPYARSIESEIDELLEDLP